VAANLVADVADENPRGALSAAPAADASGIDSSLVPDADRYPCLILLIGLPGSGKSSLAARLQQACPDRPIISTDTIRAELFGNAAAQGSWSLIQPEVLRQLRQAATAIRTASPSAVCCGAIYDATNVRRCYRRAAIATARAAGFQQIIGIWLDPPLPLCLQRNRQRDRQVPEAVIRKMHRQLRGAPPHLSDGFDQLVKAGSEIPLFSHSTPNPILS
jgi:predicted kinase